MPNNLTAHLVLLIGMLPFAGCMPSKEAEAPPYEAKGSTVCDKACDNIRHYGCPEKDNCEQVCNWAESLPYGNIRADEVAAARTLTELNEAGVECKK